MACTAEDLLALAARDLSQRRFAHVQRVVLLAGELASRFGVDREDARLAAAAHDLDREVSPGLLLARVADHAVPVTAEERRDPALLHGPVTAERLARDFGVQRPAVYEAVRHHTLGDAGLGSVFGVLYVADYCEPGRRHLEPHAREAILNADSLDRAVAACVAHAAGRFGAPADATRRLITELQHKGVY